MADIGALLGSAGIGGAIGKAIVSLELDTKKYQAELTGAEAQTKAAAGSMGTGVSKFGGLASSAFAAAGVAAVAFAAFSVKAAIDANEAHLKLANTFKNNANLSDSSVEAFERQADALRELTGVDDEAITSAEALLGAFDVTGKEVQKLIPLIVDLSAKYGVDMDAAAKAVGKAIEGNTGSLARYGVTLDAGALKADAFSAVLEGLGKNAGFAEERANAEPWRVLGSQFEEVAESVGKVLLPVLQGLTRIVGGLLPVLETLANNLDLVGVAIAGIAVYRFLPGLITSLGSAFIKLQVAVGASLSAQVGASSTFAAIASEAGPLAIAISALAFTIVGLGKSSADTAAKVQELTDSLAKGKIGTDEYRQAVVDAEVDTGVFAARLPKVVTEANKVADAGIGVATALGQQALAEAETAHQAEVLAKSTEHARREMFNFAGMSDKALKEFKDNLVESLQVSAGEFEKFNDAFDTTPRELAKQLKLAVNIARTEQRDLREIFADTSLTDAQKQALAELPANMRHAWAEGGKEAKNEIEKGAVDLARANTKGAKQAADAAKAPAKQGGTDIGKALMQGSVAGVVTGSPALAQAVRTSVLDAIQAGKDAAGAASPSKVMRELGLDMMTGLYQGITAGAQKVLDAATKEIEKLIDKIGSALDKVKGKAQSFADSIRSGFSSFMDLSGGFGLTSLEDIQAFAQQQFSGASALAATLQALKTQGAGKELLRQIAEAGPEGIPFARLLLQGGPDAIASMNASLKTISDLANQTGKGLSEHFFGEKIDRLEAKLERQNEILRDIREIERMGHGHAIILNGQVLGEAVRDELVKIGNRNGNALG